ncbi:hypothetical protein D9M73_218590 [compost metagenome]
MIDGSGLGRRIQAAPLDLQALQGEGVVGLFKGEEHLVRLCAEDPRSQCLHGGFALAQGVQVGEQRHVAFQLHQLALVIEVLVEQRHGLTFRRVVQLSGHVVAQPLDAAAQ